MPLSLRAGILQLPGDRQLRLCRLGVVAEL
jgi:hypothetical protein